MDVAAARGGARGAGGGWRAALAASVGRFAEAVRTGAGGDEIASASAPLFPLLVPGSSAGLRPIDGALVGANGEPR
jgi:hypothetical protein